MDVISRGLASDVASTVKLAQKIKTLALELAQTLEREKATKAQRDEARKRLEELEVERAKLLETLGQTPGKKAGTSDSAVIRQWAAGAGVACPKAGQVPKTVREAYLNAQAAA